jgi:hypothetical protein
MGHIFISYSRRDKDVVDRLTQLLTAAGVEIWIDREGIRGGEKWRALIVQAIRTADAVLLVLTPNAVESDNVRKELDLTEEFKKPIIPVEIEQTVVPMAIAYQIAGLQKIDLFSNFEEGMRQVQDAVRITAGAESASDKVRKNPSTERREKQDESSVRGAASSESGTGAIAPLSDFKRERAFDLQLAWYEKMIKALHYLAERIEIASTFQEDNKSSHELLAEQWETVQIAHIRLEDSANMAGLYGSAEAARNCARISKVVQKVAEKTEAFDLANHPEVVGKLELIDALPPKLREAAKPLAEEVRRHLGIK